MSGNKRKIRKILLLFVLIFLTTVTFIFETYSWFVGITTVNVNQFNINVSTADGLELSLDGSIAYGSATAVYKYYPTFRIG